jgi:hypothetical protein
MPAFNAGKTLMQTYREIPFDEVDEVLLVKDASRGDTVKVAHCLGISQVRLLPTSLIRAQHGSNPVNYGGIKMALLYP